MRTNVCFSLCFTDGLYYVSPCRAGPAIRTVRGHFLVLTCPTQLYEIHNNCPSVYAVESAECMGLFLSQVGKIRRKGGTELMDNPVNRPTYLPDFSVSAPNCCAGRRGCPGQAQLAQLTHTGSCQPLPQYSSCQPYESTAAPGLSGED